MIDKIKLSEADNSAALAGKFKTETKTLRDEVAVIAGDVDDVLYDALTGSIIRDDAGMAFTLRLSDAGIVPFLEVENLLFDPIFLGRDSTAVSEPFKLESWLDGAHSDTGYTVEIGSEYGSRFTLLLNSADPGGKHYIEQFIDFDNQHSIVSRYRFPRIGKVYAAIRAKMLDSLDGNVRVGIRREGDSLEDVKWAAAQELSEVNAWETLTFEINTDSVIEGNFYFVIWTNGTFLQLSSAYCGFTPVPAYFPGLVFVKYHTLWNPVIDGDTIRVSRFPGFPFPKPDSPESVRLLCVDTPETPPSANNPVVWALPAGNTIEQWLDQYGARADNFANDFLPAGPEESPFTGEKDVWLVFDIGSGPDQFNRLLAYVLDESGSDLGFEQMKRGYARSFMTEGRVFGSKYDNRHTENQVDEIGIYSPRPIFNSFQLQGNQLDSVIDLSEGKITVTVDDMIDLHAPVLEFSVEDRVWLVKSISKIIHSGSTLNLNEQSAAIDVVAGSNPVHKRWLLQIVLEADNQISNPFFHDFMDGWTGNTSDWSEWTGHGVIDPLVLPRSSRVQHELVSDRNLDYVVLDFHTTQSNHASVFLRPAPDVGGWHGYIRIGIRRKGFATFNYSDWLLINQYTGNGGWYELTHSIDGMQNSQDSALIRIQTTSRLGSAGNPVHPVNIVVGAVWFSDIPAPEGWPIP